MADVSFLPTLPDSDVQRTTQTIIQISDPSPGLSAEALKILQNEILEIQRRPEAWGLVIPLLNHENPQVQFFGAHTIQVKIVRDWASFPENNVAALRDLLLQLTVHALVTGKLGVITRKLFVAICALAHKIVPYNTEQWPNWIVHCTEVFSRAGVQTASLLDFLAIVSEEVTTTDLIGVHKDNMRMVCKDSTPVVLAAVSTTLASGNGRPEKHVAAALNCFKAWLPFWTVDDTNVVLPALYSLLNSEEELIFVATSDLLQELLDSSGTYSKHQSAVGHLVEPLLVWFDARGHQILARSIQDGIVGNASHSACKLLVTLGENWASELCENIVNGTLMSLAPPYMTVLNQPPKPKAQLVQGYLQLTLGYTGLPGYFGVDEETSELTNSFWYLLQEALWEATWADSQSMIADPREVSKSVYVELVKILQRKCTYPPEGHGWLRDQVDRFQAYRRDIGDTLINAFYVIRDDMLGYFIDTLVNDISAQKTTGGGWESAESTLHCISSIQEALNYETTIHLHRLFNPTLIQSLPSTGTPRLRLTVLNLLGSYASWFTYEPPESSKIVAPAGPSKVEMLLAAVGYVVSSLPDPTLSVQAALALRDLCDANRKMLAPHITAFGELHDNLSRIPDAERSKVLQSISSVIEALPPAEQVHPIENMGRPIVQKLVDVLNSPNAPPVDTRAIIVLQLETLAGVARGLTRLSDDIVDIDDEVQGQAVVRSIHNAREDRGISEFREEILAVLGRCVEMAGHDASIGQAINELVKSITALPGDITILTLPAPPILSLICRALQRQITASWLALATTLFSQMKQPVPFPISGPPTEEKSQREAEIAQQYAREAEEGKNVVRQALSMFLSITLPFFSNGQKAMDDNPDIVQGFFSLLDAVSLNFVELLYELPENVLDAVVQCSLQSMALQERYSLIAACRFLAKFIQGSAARDSLEQQRQQFNARYGKAIMRTVLVGLAGVSPRSATPNLVDLLSALLVRCVSEAPRWLKELMAEDSLGESKAGPDEKEKFLKAVIGTKSNKKIREAANQFALVARGLEGTSFGYATASN
ncbi:ARM repeat-containing protein [Cylindrobasidium torrendii FP15055 ss-10]|uniref:ARM repeat-containing protein n=1 Tax=Cylindrobasidium torrendii FP15055 ss-10 TaxID=1314674 RepID=A0A0D7BTW8_9AGAR|nr:ARM repeat-containing protein [Cylindrobasidium torrendii FP15055 ss-10]